MSSTKEDAIQAISRLPNNVDMEDIIDALCLKIIIEDRLKDLDAGEYIEHEEVKKRLLQI